MKRYGKQQIHRAAQQTRNLLGLASALVGVGVGLLRLRDLAAERLVASAMDRPSPAAVARSLASLPAPLRQEAEAAAEALRARETLRLEIRARDGVRLVGHWLPAAQPRRVVLGFHGWHSAWNRDFSLSAPFFLEQGCSLLLVEQRAHGESGGESIGYGLLERYDLLDWLEELEVRGLGAGLPVYLAGVSMGATTVMLAAGLPLPERVHGVMADCGFTSAPDIWESVWTGAQPLPYALLRGAVERLAEARLGLPPDADSTPSALARWERPALFIHGLSDHFVPPEMTKRSYAACAGPKRLLLVEGAGHALSYPKDPAAYQAALLDFWQAFDVWKQA
ncbi:MAG: alpha/beta hydrolase [Oscillospiraceae bacterium]|nr:alpha/beta hydrolase [Oscillospiraceae bacterium]